MDKKWLHKSLFQHNIVFLICLSSFLFKFKSSHIYLFSTLYKIVSKQLYWDRFFIIISLFNLFYIGLLIFFPIIYYDCENDIFFVWPLNW